MNKPSTGQKGGHEMKILYHQRSSEGHKVVAIVQHCDKMSFHCS